MPKQEGDAQIPSGSFDAGHIGLRLITLGNESNIQNFAPAILSHGSSSRWVEKNEPMYYIR